MDFTSEIQALAAAQGFDAEDFAVWLAPRLVSPDGAPEVAHLADLALVWRCVAQDAAAWRQLAAQLDALAGPALQRTSPDPRFAEEVAARCLARLAEPLADGGLRLARYQGRGPLGAWLRAVLLREAIDLVRVQQGPEVPVLTPDVFARADGAVVDQVLAAELVPLVRDALRQALAQLTSKERAIIRWRFVDGATVASIATLMGAHRATATRTLAELQERLLSHMRATLGTSHRLNASEVASIMRQVAPGLDGSLRSLLSEG